jgi:hypothetical protein
MQFKPNKRTATPMNSAAAGLHRSMPRWPETVFRLDR